MNPHSDLLETVRKGNDWMIKNWPDDIIWPHLERLNKLCQDLMDEGYRECLYETKRCDKEPTCLICPLTGRE